MLLLFIIIYLIITVTIGVMAARNVRNSGDFILAGKKLSLIMATTTVFATWFGSETVLGASSSFADGGLLAVIEDPFGAALCLLLVGFFFAKKLYRMNLLTFGDFYRNCFGKKAELIAGVFLVLSYFGWIAAQLLAIGIVLNIVTAGVIGIQMGIAISAIIVVIYTVTGGMWAIAYTDFFQMILIVAGMIAATVVVVSDAGGLANIVNAMPQEHLQFLPKNNFNDWMSYIAAWITIGLGSIPQQDVFQRVMSSKDEQTAVRSSIIAAGLYFTIALLPLLLGMAAKVLIGTVEDSQFLLPQLILQKTNIVIQVLFFGALLSAILSTASGAILAPAVIISENLIKPHFKNISDKTFLRINRYAIVFVSLVALLMAINAKGIYELVSEASAWSMVSLFVPLCAALFFKSKNETAALASMVAGFACWLLCEIYFFTIPSIITATICSALFFLLFSVRFLERK